jgi:hypothetical protein
MHCIAGVNSVMAGAAWRVAVRSLTDRVAWTGTARFGSTGIASAPSQTKTQRAVPTALEWPTEAVSLLALRSGAKFVSRAIIAADAIAPLISVVPASSTPLRR